MPDKQQPRRKKRATPASVYVVAVTLNVAGGLVMVWASSGIQPATVNSIVGKPVGWVLVVSGVGWFYLAMRQAWIPLKRLRERRRRSRQGLCVKCGYNLKGLSHLRCPECGHQNVPYEDFDEYAPLDNSRGE